jgi:hypothetical protein
MSDDIHYVSVTVEPPGPGQPQGRVAQGCYVVENVDGKEQVRMVLSDGSLVYSPDGERWIHELGEGETPLRIAARMTKQLYFAFREKDRRAGFGRPIDYEPIKRA